MILSTIVSAPRTRQRAARHSRCALIVAALALSLSGLSGCLDPAATGPKRIPLSGAVMQQGKPLPSGSISFLPTDGTTGPAANTGITNGKYQFTEENGPVVGRHRVLISRSVPKPDLTKAGQSPLLTEPPPQAQWEFTESLRESASPLRRDFKLE